MPVSGMNALAVIRMPDDVVRVLVEDADHGRERLAGLRPLRGGMRDDYREWVLARASTPVGSAGSGSDVRDERSAAIAASL
jgi:hypothetical protein